MKNKRHRIINIVAVVCVISFMVFSCLDCFEFYFTYHSAIGENVEGSLIHTGNKTNNIVAVLILGILQLCFMCSYTLFLKKISVVCAVIGALVTGIEIFKCILKVTINSNGGLGGADFKITGIGYAVIALSLTNVIIQVIGIKNEVHKINSNDNNFKS